MASLTTNARPWCTDKSKSLDAVSYPFLNKICINQVKFSAKNKPLSRSFLMLTIQSRRLTFRVTNKLKTSSLSSSSEGNTGYIIRSPCKMIHSRITWITLGESSDMKHHQEGAKQTQPRQSKMMLSSLEEYGSESRNLFQTRLMSENLMDKQSMELMQLIPTRMIMDRAW